MKILIGFALGAICGVAAMFYFPGQWQVSRPTQSMPTAASPASMLDAPVRAAALASSMPPVSLARIPQRSAPAEAAATADAAVASSAPGEMDLPESAVSGLLIPVVGVKPADLTDTFTQARGAGRVHDAIDIMAVRGTPVVAANDGHVVKLFTSKPGGLTMYQYDPDNRVIYYYAHLDGYAPGLAEGQILHRGDLVGFVGSTGNASADAPHLHFEIELLGPEKQWWHATSINPYGRFEGQPPAHAASASIP